MSSKNPPTELPLRDMELPPLLIHVSDSSSSERSTPNQVFDAIADISWRGDTFRFGVEYIPQATPRAFQTVIQNVIERANRERVHPLLAASYLSEEQLRVLEQRTISGIDLSGNGVVVVPDKLLVFRTGSPNRFSSSRPIKNIYRKNTSLGPRVFLVRSEYSTVKEVHEEIKRRGGVIALSTVSKALDALEEDLIIGRESGTIRLLQPEKLLDRLVANFEPARIERTYSGKIDVDLERLSEMVAHEALNQNVHLAVTGIGSISRYAVMANERKLSVYCSDRDRLLSQLPVQPESFFPNLELLETQDDLVYFDTRYRDGYPWASPIQTYLELMAGEQRSRETADQVRSLILTELAQQEGR